MNYNQIKAYNHFIDYIKMKNISVENLKVETGINQQSKKEGIYFTIDIHGGITDCEAKSLFGSYLKMFPDCGISYNLPDQLSILEQELINKSESVVSVNKMFIPEKIHTNTPHNINPKVVKTNNRNIKTYLMIDNINGFCKIGKSVNPQYREKTLQSEKPTIEIIHVISKDIEKTLHEQFKDKRIRGEWFNLNQDDINQIKSIL